MQQGSYIDYMSKSREDLKALMVWRLCLPNLQARKSTDITQVLRWLMAQAGVRNLSQLEDKIGGNFGNGYLKQYWNPKKGKGKPKQMSIAKTVFLLKSAHQMGLIKNDVALGGMLISLDKHEMLGRLASRWRSLKYPAPESEEDWRNVWRLAEIEASGVWHHHDDWQRYCVQLAISRIVDQREGQTMEPRFIEQGKISQCAFTEFFVGQKITGVATLVVGTTKGPLKSAD